MRACDGLLGWHIARRAFEFRKFASNNGGKEEGAPV